MGESLAIINGSVLLPGGQMRTCDILAEAGRITQVGNGLRGETTIDAAGAHVLPGLIDLHTHGIRHSAVGTCALEEYAREEASLGATTLFPTLFAPPKTIALQLGRYREETDELRALPQIGGFRLESPYLACTGAGQAANLAPISDEITETLLEAGGGHIRIWDVSPELPGAPGLIRRLTGEGIVCSLAHTKASPEQARAAIDAGARLVTHLFDVFELPEVTDPGVYPAGLVDYLLIEDRVACEIIGDGTHVHPFHVENALRCKPDDGVAFVTDSNLGSGLAPGRYSLTNGWGDVIVGGDNDGVRLVDRDLCLAGSALTPIGAFRNAVRLFGKDLAAASSLCSTNPARIMGLNKGEIAPGRDADLIILSPGLDLHHTISAGQIIYTASMGPMPHP